ncbi:hypothetical protein [Rhodoplanes serenus]|uniref:hypothetical protein n=1 Tax=Rhodoplanes serenus TaxID=200615 RepID=UPI001FE123EB|nr:hypothetical protein [Rhodoplanes serenus]
MDDATDHAAVVHPRLATRVGRKMRTDTIKLRLGQPEEVSTHHGSSPRAVNHKLLPTILWVRTLVLYFDAEQKAGFKEDQPRWPKGNGEISGRWSGGAGTDASAAEGASGSPGLAPRGHHFVHRSLYEKLSLRPDTRKVFETAVTGPLRAGPHGWSKEHYTYNRAVEESFERYLRDNRIRIEDMTPDEARKFIEATKRSTDPRIRAVNMRIYMREIMYWLRRVPHGNE